MSVTVNVPRQPAAEKAALEDMLQSEGWAIFEVAMRERFSSNSFEADVRTAMEEAGPDTDIRAVMGQINATYSLMRQMLDWPKEQLRTLGQAPSVKPRDKFAMFRRVAR